MSKFRIVSVFVSGSSFIAIKPKDNQSLRTSSTFMAQPTKITSLLKLHSLRTYIHEHFLRAPN
jgi:hypothetical protein